ncbi:hypothetical protein RNZ50_01085 [Paracoccaceae bacterium Fryx2]|nr:hypothetical protein [Paracoccaceae bacterium Fryx2]
MKHRSRSPEQNDLLRPRLVDLIDMRHELVKLSALIERTHPKLSVGAQCRLLSNSRSSFYYAPQGETAMNLDLMLLIDKQFLDAPFSGVRQMTWHRQNKGHAVTQAADLMKYARPSDNFNLTKACNRSRGQGNPFPSLRE